MFESLNKYVVEMPRKLRPKSEEIMFVRESNKRLAHRRSVRHQLQQHRDKRKTDSAERHTRLNEKKSRLR